MARKNDKQIAIDWAKRLLADENTLILDTETTDLNGEIVEIAIIDIKGNTLLNKRIKPQGTFMHPKALATHQISLKMLENEPEFKDVYEEIQSIVRGKTVIIYNLSFDIGRLRHDCMLAELDMIEFDDYDCAMHMYSQFVGDWNEYHGNYRWQRLPSGDHSALGDCLATLAVIKRMVESED